MRILTRLSDQRGSSVVEFALVAPLLLLLTVAASDFARVFMEATATVSASNAGVVFGSRRNIDSVNYSEMETRALADIFGADGAIVTSNLFCDCPQSPGSAVNCLSGSCPSYGKPRVYVRTSVARQFNTFAKYPGVPKDIDLRADGWMRVQ